MRRLITIVVLSISVALAVKAPMVAWQAAGAGNVYAICRDCGLERAEIDEKIETKRAASEHQTRAELLQAYFATAAAQASCYIRTM